MTGCGWAATPTEASTKPLSGIRVLELARILAGPWCGQLLADLGAEVIKIERPGSGDDTRHWGPPFVMSAAGENLGAAYYHSANRGKRSIAVDIATPAGQDIIRGLAASADIMIENYKVGGLAKYGLDHAALSQINPGIAAADLFTGVYSAVAVLAALNRRQETGMGAYIDMALLDTQVSVMGNQALNWMTSGVVPRRVGNGHANLVPYQAFPTRDGDLIIAVGNDGQFSALCRVLDITLDRDERFISNPQRIRNRKDLIEALEAVTAQWDGEELFAQLEEAGIPAGPINELDQVFANPQVIARGMAIERHGRPGVASPIVIDGVRMVSDRPAPGLPEEIEPDFQ